MRAEKDGDKRLSTQLGLRNGWKSMIQRRKKRFRVDMHDFEGRMRRMKMYEGLLSLV